LIDKTRKRKADHIRIGISQNVQARNVTTGFEDIRLVHRALPEVDKDGIDLATTVFNHKFAAPIIVSAITGGTPEAEKINATIATVVEKLGLGMGGGEGQRAVIEDRTLEKNFFTYSEGEGAHSLLNGEHRWNTIS